MSLDFSTTLLKVQFLLAKAHVKTAVRPNTSTWNPVLQKHF